MATCTFDSIVAFKTIDKIIAFIGRAPATNIEIAAHLGMTVTTSARYTAHIWRELGEIRKLPRPAKVDGRNQCAPWELGFDEALPKIAHQEGCRRSEARQIGIAGHFMDFAIVKPSALAVHS